MLSLWLAVFVAQAVEPRVECRVESTVASIPVEQLQRACLAPIMSIKVSGDTQLLTEELQYDRDLVGLTTSGNSIPSMIVQLALARYDLYTQVDQFLAYRLTVLDRRGNRVCSVSYSPQKHGEHPGRVTIECAPAVGSPIPEHGIRHPLR